MVQQVRVVFLEVNVVVERGGPGAGGSPGLKVDVRGRRLSRHVDVGRGVVLGESSAGGSRRDGCRGDLRGVGGSVHREGWRSSKHVEEL